tara:strand:+ start:56 stop:1126 length:1071 start_codon:yes stop_codon:yes gene_type:complete
MKIVHLISSLAGGPAKVMVPLIINKLHSDNHSIFVLSDLIIDKELHLQLISNDIEVNFVQRRFFFDIRPPLILYRLTKNLPPNLILSYDNYSNVIGFLRVLFKSKIKLICSVHGLKGAFKWWKIPLQKIIYKLANFVVVPSIHVKNKLVLNKIIDQNKIKVIHNGIDLNFCIKKKISLENEVKIVCLANFYSEIKGQKYLLHALKFLPYKFKIYFIGDGILIDSIKKLVVDYKLNDRVTFLGFKNETFLRKNLSKYDVMVIPSLSESFCIAALEGMASGLPVIASNVGGLKEIFKQNQNGILVKPGNSQSIANELKNLTNNIKKYKFIKENGLKSVRNNFNQELMVKNYYNVFKSL